MRRWMEGGGKMSFIAGYLLGTTESGSHDPGELYCDHNGVYTTSACWDRVTVNVPVTPSGYTFPNGTEYTDIVKVTGSDPITDITADKRLCAEIRPCGPLTVQLIRDEQGVEWYIEINPRFGGGAPISMRAGADIAESVLRLISDEPVQSNSQRI